MTRVTLFSNCLIWHIQIIFVALLLSFLFSGCTSFYSPHKDQQDQPTRGVTICLKNQEDYKGELHLRHAEISWLTSAYVTGEYSCTRCIEEGIRGMADEFSSLGFDVKSVTMDEDALRSGCNFFISAVPNVEVYLAKPISQGIV